MRFEKIFGVIHRVCGIAKEWRRRSAKEKDSHIKGKKKESRRKTC